MILSDDEKAPEREYFVRPKSHSVDSKSGFLRFLVDTDAIRSMKFHVRYLHTINIKKVIKTVIEKKRRQRRRRVSHNSKLFNIVEQKDSGTFSPRKKKHALSPHLKPVSKTPPESAQANIFFPTPVPPPVQKNFETIIEGNNCDLESEVIDGDMASTPVHIQISSLLNNIHFPSMNIETLKELNKSKFRVSGIN